MHNISKTGTDRYTIIIEQNVRFQVGIYCEKFQTDEIDNGRPAATFDFNKERRDEIAVFLIFDIVVQN